MKLFTKLTSLTFCWQSPHDSVSPFEQENATASLNPQPKRRRRTSASSSGHWQPELTAISEDNCGGDDMRRIKVVEKVKRVKVVRGRVKPRCGAGSSSWKVQSQIAMPAFSPTPFMF